MTEKKFIVPHNYKVDASLRNKLNGHTAKVLWFTGLSGSGKSTIADRVEQLFMEAGIRTYLLDGDNVRLGLNKGLGFSEEDRKENLRRIAEVSRLFVDAGILVLSAFVSPFKKDREMIAEIIGKGQFIEIFVNTPLEICESRDVKGLYKKARKGEITNFTGIQSPYEAPDNPAIELKTVEMTVEESAQKIFNTIIEQIKLQP